MSKCVCEYVNGVRINPYCPVHDLYNEEATGKMIEKMLEDDRARYQEAKRELLIKGRLAEKRLRLRPKEQQVRRVIRQEVVAERRESNKLFPTYLMKAI